MMWYIDRRGCGGDYEEGVGGEWWFVVEDMNTVSDYRLYKSEKKKKLKGEGVNEPRRKKEKWTLKLGRREKKRQEGVDIWINKCVCFVMWRDDE